MTFCITIPDWAVLAVDWALAAFIAAYLAGVTYYNLKLFRQRKPHQ
jgi:hypothetical protein